MRSAALTTGRRFLVVLDPGEDLLETVSSWAVANGIISATIDMFFGAFRRVGLIAADGPIEDPEAPLPASVDVTYLEGVGAGSISTVDGIPRAHLHVAAGVKAEAGAPYAGHVPLRRDPLHRGTRRAGDPRADLRAAAEPGVRNPLHALQRLTRAGHRTRADDARAPDQNAPRPVTAAGGSGSACRAMTCSSMSAFVTSRIEESTISS